MKGLKLEDKALQQGHPWCTPALQHQPCLLAGRDSAFPSMSLPEPIAQHFIHANLRCMLLYVKEPQACTVKGCDCPVQPQGTSGEEVGSVSCALGSCWDPLHLHHLRSSSPRDSLQGAWGTLPAVQPAQPEKVPHNQSQGTQRLQDCAESGSCHPPRFLWLGRPARR